MLLFASDLSAYAIPAIFVAIVVVLLIITFVRKLNYQKNVDNMFNGLEVGDKVKTYAGIYGEIVSIRDAKDGSRVAVIKTGDEEHFSYIEIDIASVYALDEKDSEPQQDEEESEEQDQEQVEQTAQEETETQEEVQAENKEETVETEESEQEQPAEKPKKKSKKAKAE